MRPGYVPSVRVLAAMAVAGVAGACAAGATAGAQQTGTLTVRLVTDPAPAGATWKYSGAGTAFKLGRATERTVALQPGTYQLHETGGRKGQPRTLTTLACDDPSGDTNTSAAEASASVALQDGETVTCTFTHRALGPLPSAAKLDLARTLCAGPPAELPASRTVRFGSRTISSVSMLHSGTPPHGRLRKPTRPSSRFPTTSGRELSRRERSRAERERRALPGIEQQLREPDPRATVYWHVARQPSTGRVAIEYWFLYLYNDFYDKHEADWEGVTVFLHGDAPIGVSYSHTKAATGHDGRRTTRWHPPVRLRGARLARRLSGAAATDQGLLDAPRPALHPSPKADDACGTGGTLTPSGYDLAQLGGTGYSGGWGSGLTSSAAGRRDHLTDPRRRSDYKNPFTILTH